MDNPNYPGGSYQQSGASGIFGTSVPSQDDRTLAILSHILTLVAGFIAPLIIYLIKKDQSEGSYAAAHAKESLNFQLSLIIYFIISFVLMLVIIGVLLMAALSIFALVVVIVATVKAANNEYYRYPLCIRFIS